MLIRKNHSFGLLRLLHRLLCLNLIYNIHFTLNSPSTFRSIYISSIHRSYRLLQHSIPIALIAAVVDMRRKAGMFFELNGKLPLPTPVLNSYAVLQHNSMMRQAENAYCICTDILYHLQRLKSILLYAAYVKFRHS